MSTPRQGEPEIWFVRDGRAYVPCHWKGLAFLIGFIGGGVSAAFVLFETLSSFGLPTWASLVAIFVSVPAAIGLWVYIAERHTAGPP